VRRGDAASRHVDIPVAGSDIPTNMKTSQALPALAALAQETRLNVFRLLVEHAPEGLPAGQIAERLDVAATSLSFHLKELTHAGLIVPQQVGRFVWYRADLAAIAGLVAFLTENCCASSAACDPACAPTAPVKAVAVPLPRGKGRKSA
jgi:ArsR family transcriptional regulator, arsenate/arsenite/antimonite-responsive transcriptional repressor